MKVAGMLAAAALVVSAATSKPHGQAHLGVEFLQHRVVPLVNVAHQDAGHGTSTESAGECQRTGGARVEEEAATDADKGRAFCVASGASHACALTARCHGSHHSSRPVARAAAARLAHGGYRQQAPLLT